MIAILIMSLRVSQQRKKRCSKPKEFVVRAHEKMSVGITLAAGHYNVYTADLDGAQILLASEDGAGETEIHAHKNGLSGLSKTGLYPRLMFMN